MPNEGISQEGFYECQIEKMRTILDRADCDRERSVPNPQTFVAPPSTRYWQFNSHLAEWAA
jgi:hypothetical protein